MLEPLFHAAVVKLFDYVLRSTYTVHERKVFEQTVRVAMDSPLSPGIADIFMESFEKMALEMAPYEPTLYKRYVDYMLLVWPHGRAALDDFVTLLNGLKKNIKFLMEIEQEKKLPSLNILVRHPDGTLRRTVHQKPTHTNLYLQHSSDIQSLLY